MWWGIFISAARVVARGDDDWGWVPNRLDPCAFSHWSCYRWVIILSPILTMVLMLFVSGIPTAEGQAQERYMKVLNSIVLLLFSARRV
jgi:hypothetical protein